VGKSAFAASATAPDGVPVVIRIRDESQFGPPFCTLEVLAADRRVHRDAGRDRAPDGRRRRVPPVGAQLQQWHATILGNQTLGLPVLPKP